MKSAAEKILAGFCWTCVLVLVASFTVLLGYLAFRGASALGLELLFGDTPPLEAVTFRKPVYGGLWPAILGTLFLVALALGLALPVGTAAGIYLAEYGKGRLKRMLSLFFDILSSIPSIIVGLFGFSVAVFLHQRFSGRIYPCLLVSAVSLAFLVLPYIIRTTQVSLEAVPLDLRRTAPALGATRLQNLRLVLLPRSFSGMMSGAVLAMGRCAEDTAVIMLTGVAASAGMPRSLLDSYEALPFYIYYISAQYGDADELAGGFGAALILVFICMLLLGVAMLVKYRFKASSQRI